MASYRNGHINNIRCHALEKIALLSTRSSIASSSYSSLERLQKIAPNRTKLANGVSKKHRDQTHLENIPLKVSELEVLLALCRAAPHVKDPSYAKALLDQLSLYVTESYAQTFHSSVSLKKFEPCPWEVLTSHVTSALLSIGRNHVDLQNAVINALNDYIKRWTQAVSSLTPSSIDGGELDEHVHETEIVETLTLLVSMLGFLTAVTDQAHFWGVQNRMRLAQNISFALSGQFMTSAEVALSIVRNSQRRSGYLKEWRRYCKIYSADSRPLGATLLQNSYMEFVLKIASLLILPNPDSAHLSLPSRLMTSPNIRCSVNVEETELEELVGIAMDEMKLLEDDYDFLPLRSAWVQRLAHRIKANTLLTYLCCSIVDQEVAEPQILMTWLEETLWDPTQMADEILADTTLRCMAILSKVSPSLATDLSRLLPRFIVQSSLAPHVASTVADCLAYVLKMLSSDAVITTLYSLGNVLSANSSKSDRSSTVFPFSDDLSRSNALEESFHQKITGSTISLPISDNDERSIVHGNIVKTIVQIAIVYNDENLVDLARSMLIQKGGSVDQATDLQIVEQSAKMGTHGSLNDFRSLLKVYSRLCCEAIASKNSSLTEAVMKARTYLSSSLQGDTPMYGVYISHLLNEIVCKGEILENNSEHDVNFELSARDIAQLLQPLAYAVQNNSAAYEELCSTDEMSKLQRDAWFNIVIHGFDLFSNLGKDNIRHLRILAQHSNPLVSEDWAGELESDVELNIILRRGVNTSLLASHRLKLIESFPAYENELRVLSYPETVFLNAAFVLESLRSESGNCAKSLTYFLDPNLRSSAAGNCMAAIATGAVTRYINKAATGKLQSFSAPYIAEQLAIILIKCCHRVSRVQEVASKCATQLIEAIPPSLCQKRSLFVMLELLDLMWTSCLEEEADEFGWKSTFRSKREGISLELSDDYNFRKSTLIRFYDNAKAWLFKAINIAPLDVKGLLQTYLSDFDEEAVFGHVSLGRSLALEMGAVVPTTDHRLAAIEHHDLNINTASDFLAQYTHRQEYRLIGSTFNDKKIVASSTINGTSDGVLRKGDSTSSIVGNLSSINNSKRLEETTHTETLLRDLEEKVINNRLVTIDQLRDVLRKAATLLCSTTYIHNTIIHYLVSIPLKVFTKQAVKLGISLWTGVIKENPLVEFRLMVEIAIGWKKTVSERMGFFARQFGNMDPFFQKHEFAPTSKAFILSQQNQAQNLISPHYRISQFFLSRFRASRLDNQQTQRVYARLMLTTLASMPRAINHPLARETHFQIILLGLYVLRFTTVLTYADKWRLKDSLLSAALSWFSSPPRWSYGGNRLHVKAETHLLADVEGFLHSTEAIGINDVGSLASLKAKQNLLLLLLNDEQRRLMVWLYPTAHERRSYFALTPSKESPEATLMASVGGAWLENPALAIQLMSRFHSPALNQRVRSLLLQLPHLTLEDANAVEFLLGSSLPGDVDFQLKYLLFWAPVNPITAVTYFLPAYKNHPFVLQYAMKALKSHSVDVTFFYVPQIVQALRFDSLEYIERYIIEAAKFSQLFAHQIIWNMKANAFRDEDAQVPDPMKPTLDKVMERLISSFSDLDRVFYEKEFSFFNEVTGISGKLRPFIKKTKPEKKQKIEEELRNIKVELGVYLPSNPDGIVVGIDRKSGTPLQSHAKAPYKATFRIRKKKDPETLKGRDNSAEDQSAKVAPDEPTYEVWQSAIFKVGDDCRQDVLALQMISVFRGIFHSVGLDGYVFPYRVTATAPGCGVIDVLPNAVSRDMLGREAVNGLYDYFLTKFGSEESVAFQEARCNFVKSMAAYSVICYLLQLKDRHNGNVMIDDAGHILHIDFGFCFDIAPGGVRFERAPFKLTAEMVAVMGGSTESQPFRWFEELAIKAFLASRCHANHLAHMVLTMLDSGLPCFKPETIAHFKERFVLERSEKEAASFMKDLVRKSYNSYSTRGYDQFQLLTNGIPY